ERQLRDAQCSVDREAGPLAAPPQRVQFAEPFLAPPDAGGPGEQCGDHDEQTTGCRACLLVALMAALARVSSSASIVPMLSRAATGAKISSDSRALRSCFAF